MNTSSTSHFWRHMARHWQLYGLVLLLLTVASTLLSSMPLLARELANTSLQHSLQAMPISQRNILLQGHTLSGSMESRLQEELGDIFVERFEMRDSKMLSEATVLRPTGPDPIDQSLLDFLNLHLHSFERISEHVDMVDGRLPNPKGDARSSNPAELIDPEIEAAVGRGAAELLDLHVGDVIPSFDGQWEFKIVGIVEPTNPDDERWWGDHQLVPFNYWRRIQFGPPDFVEITMGVLVNPGTLATTIPSQRSWRVLLDTSGIDEERATAVAETLQRLESNLTQPTVSFSSGLLTVLEEFRSDIETGQLSLLLLVSQSLLAILYTLTMLGQAVLAQAAGEVATLTARGHDPWQVTRQFATRYGLLALLAWLLGLQTAALLYPQTPLPTLSWQLGAATSMLGFLALIWSVPGVAQRGVLVWLHQQTRPETARDWLRRLVFDVAILGLGGLSYWQLRQFSTQALAGEEAITVDPLLLLGPTVLILGFALLLRHIAPLIIRLVAWVSRRSTTLLLPLALAWLGRDRGRSGRIIFLVSVASGLAVFAAIFTDSLTTRQDEMAWYNSGADLRWSVLGTDLETVTAALRANEQVAAVTTVFRHRTVPVPMENTAQINLLAVSPTATDVIAAYPTDVHATSLATTLAMLAEPAPDAVPILMSRRNVVPGTAVGDHLLLRVGVEEVPVEVRGIIEAFATLREPFVVMNLEALRPFLDKQGHDVRLNESYEVWASVNSKQYAASSGQSDSSLITDYGSQITDFGEIGLQPSGLGDAAALRAQYGNHLLSQQILGVFRLNVWVLVILSFTSLLLLQLLDGWRRRPSWGTLMTIGISRQEVARVMINEGVTLVGVGLAVGIGLGLILAQITLPLLAVTLSASMGGSVTAPLLLDWFNLGQLLLTIGILYVVGIAIPAWVISRVNMAQLLRWQV